MKKFQTLIMAISLIAVSSAFGFNGNRQGFVLGGGLGIAPVSTWSVESGPFGTIDESGAGIGLSFVIGHAWNEKNMIVYEGNVTGWQSDYYNMTVSQGFNGGAWYHYYAVPGNSAFTTFGLGLYLFDRESGSGNDIGPGFLAGGGFEFAKHWQVGGYLSLGRTNLGSLDFDHSHLNVLVSGLAF